MKRLVNIIAYILAIFGVIFIIVFFGETIQENKMDKAYRTNCGLVEIGMTIDQVKETMNEGLDISYDGFRFQIISSNDIIESIFMVYSIDGGSYNIHIEIDKNTGRVKSIDCPNN